MLVAPSELVELIELMPAMVENCFSSGVATAEAMVSGLAPGSTALTLMVGKSTLGRSLTGSEKYANIPNIRMAAITRLVMIGRLMKIAEMFTAALRNLELPESSLRPAPNLPEPPAAP